MRIPKVFVCVLAVLTFLAAAGCDNRDSAVVYYQNVPGYGLIPVSATVPQGAAIDPATGFVTYPQTYAPAQVRYVRGGSRVVSSDPNYGTANLLTDADSVPSVTLAPVAVAADAPVYVSGVPATGQYRVVYRKGRRARLPRGMRSRQPTAVTYAMPAESVIALSEPAVVTPVVSESVVVGTAETAAEPTAAIATPVAEPASAEVAVLSAPVATPASVAASESVIVSAPVSVAAQPQFAAAAEPVAQPVAEPFPAVAQPVPVQQPVFVQSDAQSLAAQPVFAQSVLMQPYPHQYAQPVGAAQRQTAQPMPLMQALPPVQAPLPVPVPMPMFDPAAQPLPRQQFIPAAPQAAIASEPLSALFAYAGPFDSDPDMLATLCAPGSNLSECFTMNEYQLENTPLPVFYPDADEPVSFGGGSVALAAAAPAAAIATTPAPAARPATEVAAATASAPARIAAIATPAPAIPAATASIVPAAPPAMTFAESPIMTSKYQALTPPREFAEQAPLPVARSGEPRPEVTLPTPLGNGEIMPPVADVSEIESALDVMLSGDMGAPVLK